MPTLDWKEKTHTIAVFNEDHDFIKDQAKAQGRSLIKQIQFWIQQLRKGKKPYIVKVPK